MADFTVRPRELKGEAQVWKNARNTLRNSASSMNDICNSLSISGSAAGSIKSALKKSVEQLESLSKSSETVCSTLKDISGAYTKAEATIVGSSVLEFLKWLDDGQDISYTNGDVTGYSKWSFLNANSTPTDKSIGGNASVFDLTTGIAVPGASIEGYINCLKAEGSVGYTPFGVYAKGNATGFSDGIKVSSDEGSVDIKAGILNADGKLSIGIPENYKGTFGISGKAGANVATASVEAVDGSEHFNEHGSASITALGAEASADIGVVHKDGEYGVGTKFEAEAYYAKAEVSSGITFCGLKIDVKGEAMMGVQVKAGGEVTTKGLGAEGGFGPFEVGIKVDWSGVPDFCSDVVDYFEDFEFSDLKFW